MSIPPITATNKPKSNPSSLIKLAIEYIIGHTIDTSHDICAHPINHDIIAYISCNHIVIHNIQHNKQLHYINTIRDNSLMSCITYNSNGSLLAVAECGVSPFIYIYSTLTYELMYTIPTQCTNDIQQLLFSTNNSLLLCISTLDNRSTINIHDYTTSSILYTTTTGTPIISCDWHKTDSYFVASGRSLLQFYNYTYNDKLHQLNVQSVQAKLGVHSNETFVSVKCGHKHISAKIYALTSVGVLCVFKLKPIKSSAAAAAANVMMMMNSKDNDTQWELDKWVDLRLERGYSISLLDKIIAISGADSKIRLFEPDQLIHIATLPKPNTINKLINMKSSTACCSVVLSCDASKLITIYTDHTLLIWDIGNRSNKQPVTLLHQLISHHHTVWDIQNIPVPDIYGDTVELDAIQLNDITKQELQQKQVQSHYPSNTFITCSSDNTIKLWSFDTNNKSCPLHHSVDLVPVPDITTDDYGARVLSVNSITDRNTLQQQLQLVTGDQYGHLRIFDLTNELQQKYCISAHSDMISGIDYSSQQNTIMSGSSDTLIHIYNNDMTCGTVPYIHSILPGQTSAVRNVRYICQGQKLVCSTQNQSIIFYQLQSTNNQYQPSTVLQVKSSIVSLLYHPNQKFVVCMTSDRLIRILEVSSEKQIRSYRIQCTNNKQVEPIELCIDNQGIFLCVVTSDDYIHICDFYTGSCLSHYHINNITKCIFSSDCNKLYASTTSGSIIILKLREQPTVQSIDSNNTNHKHERRRSDGTLLTARRVTKTALDFLGDSDDSEDEKNDIGVQGEQAHIDTDSEHENDAVKSNNNAIPSESINEVDTVPDNDNHRFNITQHTEFVNDSPNLSRIQLSPIISPATVPCEPINIPLATITDSPVPINPNRNNHMLPIWAQSTNNNMTQSNHQTNDIPKLDLPVNEISSDSNISSSSSTHRTNKWQDRIPHNGLVLASDLTQKGLKVQLGHYQSPVSINNDSILRSSISAHYLDTFKNQPNNDSHNHSSYIMPEPILIPDLVSPTNAAQLQQHTSDTSNSNSNDNDRTSNNTNNNTNHEKVFTYESNNQSKSNPVQSAESTTITTHTQSTAPPLSHKPSIAAFGISPLINTPSTDIGLSAEVKQQNIDQTDIIVNDTIQQITAEIEYERSPIKPSQYNKRNSVPTLEYVSSPHRSPRRHTNNNNLLHDITNKPTLHNNFIDGNDDRQPGTHNTFHQLQQSIQHSLHLFKQLKSQPIQQPNLVLGGLDNTDTTQSLHDLTIQYEEQLIQLRSQIDSVIGHRLPYASVNSSRVVQLPQNTIDMQHTIEKYSDAIVDAVMKKLNKT